LTFWTFAIAKFETSYFLICANETKILESSFESTESETESQQSTLKLHESLVLCHWNFISLCLVYDQNLSLHKNIAVTYNTYLGFLGVTTKIGPFCAMHVQAKDIITATIEIVVHT
jgi:hypothetical protein